MLITKHGCKDSKGEKSSSDCSDDLDETLSKRFIWTEFEMKDSFEIGKRAKTVQVFQREY